MDTLHSPEVATPQSPEATIAQSTENAAASSSVTFPKGSPAGSKTPESPTGCRSPGSPIGDDACPICLGSFTDKCAAGSCLHNFCLVCLKEWAKQRPVCPLCKQSFTKILYDIKSETDYKEWKVPILFPNDLNDLAFRGFRQFRQFFDPYERSFFGYRSTFPRLGRRRHPASSINPNNTDSLPAVVVRGRQQQQQQQQQQQPLYHDRGSSLFRLSIYTNNVWIQPLSDLTGRYRESSPLLYHEQPALTHRLVPWVNRELAALLPASRIGVVLSDIMDLIERYPIDSTEFRLALRLHLGSRTRHFVHEFYNFARSPYDMVGHDNAAQYIPHYDDENESAEEDSDDEVIEVESDGVVVESEPLDLSSSVAREETIGNDGSVFISSDTDISLSDEENNDDIETHRANSDSPSYNFRLTSLFSRTRNLLPSIPAPSSSEERIQTSNGLEEPGPSGVSSSSSASIKKENRNQRNSSDSDDCLIVDILKPKRERTPELINLSSDSEEAVIEGKTFNKTHWKKKMSKEIENKDTYKHSKGRKRPRLDRTSFSLHFSGTLNCQRGEDHTYCTESASPCNPSSNRTESDDDFGRNYNDHESRSSFRSKPQRQRWNRVESDSDSDMETEINASLKKRSKTATTKHRRERTSRHRAVSSSVSRSFPSLRKSRKDQKSKVKSSSKATKSVTQITSKEGKPPSHQSSSKRKVTSSHKPKKGNSSNSYKRSRHDSTSSSSSSLSSRSSDSSNSSSSTSTTTTSSSSTSSTSSSSSSERRSRSHLLVFKNSSVSSESESSSSSYSTSSFIVSSSSDSEYYPSKRSASCKRKDKQNTARIPRAVDKNKSERNLDKRNPSKIMNTKKSKYHKK